MIASSCTLFYKLHRLGKKPFDDNLSCPSPTVKSASYQRSHVPYLLRIPLSFITNMYQMRLKCKYLTAIKNWQKASLVYRSICISVSSYFSFSIVFYYTFVVNKRTYRKMFLPPVRCRQTSRNQFSGLLHIYHPITTYWSQLYKCLSNNNNNNNNNIHIHISKAPWHGHSHTTQSDTTQSDNLKNLSKLEIGK